MKEFTKVRGGKSEVGSSYPKSDMGSEKAAGGSGDGEPEDMVVRTKKFALRILRLVGNLPSSTQARVIGHQLMKSGISVGANYRAARRSRSKAEFLSRLGIVEEEADETLYWIELLEDGGIVPAEKLANLKQEADELLRITVASLKTGKQNQVARK